MSRAGRVAGLVAVGVLASSVIVLGAVLLPTLVRVPLLASIMAAPTGSDVFATKSDAQAAAALTVGGPALVAAVVALVVVSVVVALRWPVAQPGPPAP